MPRFLASGFGLSQSLSFLDKRIAGSGNEIASRCERTLVLSGHVISARLPYEVGVGRLITFVSKCFKIVTVLIHYERAIKVCRVKKRYIFR